MSNLAVYYASSIFCGVPVASIDAKTGELKGDIVMKKLLSIVITTIMVLGFVPFMGNLSTAANVSAADATNTPAIFIANRWQPVGTRWNGTTLVEDRNRYFNGVGTAWGRSEYKMPGPGAYIDIAVIDPARPLRINATPDEVAKREPTGVQLQQLTSQPLYWTEFYLTVIPDKGASQLYDHWYAVVDNMGQLWFDPDGRFNDSRYYAAADPETEAYRAITGGSGSDNCKNNPYMKVDSSVANNTQGPYIYMPTDIYGNFIMNGITRKEEYPLFNSTGLFFRTSQGRVFQVGYVDMPDFPLIRGGASPIQLQGVSRPNIEQIGTNLVDTTVGQTNVITDTTVLPYTTRPILDWDRDDVGNGITGLPLVRFLDGWEGAVINALPPAPVPYTNPPTITVGAYFQTDNDIFNYGEEWHSTNVVIDPPDTTQFPSPAMDIYDPGEYIYRAGLNAHNLNSRYPAGYDYMLQQDIQWYQYYGTTRLTPVTMFFNGLFFNYAPGTIIRDRGPANGGQYGYYDAGDDVDLNDPATPTQQHTLYRFPVSMMNFSGIPGQVAPINVTQYCQLHADNVNYNSNPRCASGDDIYDPYEGIYMKSETTPNVVSGDYRMTNLNGNSYGLESWLGLGGGVVSSLYPLIMKVGGIWSGDVLILSELVTGGCSAPKYNLSVQTDLWQGVIPSETVAALRSPNKEFDRTAQNIQKNAVLDPTGTKFEYPSTVFQDMKFGYREYVGVEVFRDDNKDCNWGYQYAGPVPPGENLFMLNLSDDYRQGHTGEMHIGMKDGYAAKDVGRMLTQFWPANADPLPPNGPATPNEIGPRFYDTTNPGGWGIENYYGVGESIYLDNNGNYEIDAGDLRMSDVTVQRGAMGFAEIVKYEKGSYVTAGDADIDLWGGANNDLSDFVPILTNGRVVYWPAFYDELIEDVLNPGHYLPPNGKYDINEVIYDCSYNGSSIVGPGFQRLMDVTLGGIVYKAGSIVPDPDLWVYQMPIYGLSMGYNCDYNYADMMALPGKTGMKVTIDKPLKVEQTSEIQIDFDPAPKKEYYDDQGVYHPEEVIYVFIRNLGLSIPNNNATINEIYRVVSGRQPQAKFQFTPYRGSCTNGGNNDKLNYLEDSNEYRVKIRSFRDLGGTNNPAPLDRDYNDPWFVQRNSTSTDARWGRPYRLASYGVRVRKPELTPPMPYNLANGYDCYQEAKYDIAPEELDIEPSVACLQTLDQRFPNFSVKLRDDDNPDDVNDPNGIMVSVPLTGDTNVDPIYGREQYLISTYNAHGGGVDWIGTAIDDNPGQARRQYIVQVNTDGSYLYWYWLEPVNPAGNDRSRPQIEGALDSNDILIGQDFTGTFNWRPNGGPYIPPDQRTCRTPVIIKDKATWYDTDCSSATVEGRKYSNCQSCKIDGMKEMGDVNGLHVMWNAARTMTSTVPARLSSDYYGRFDGVGPLNSTTTVAAWIAGINPPWPGNQMYPNSQLWTGPWATGYGVQTVVTSYGQRDANDAGGEALVAILPRDGSSHLLLQMYTVNALFDYNSSIPHPSTGSPYFVLDPVRNQGIDYCGTVDIKVYQPDPYVNFAEWSIVDHGLQNSSLNYTSGNDPLSRLSIPTPQIQTPYNPVLRTSKGEFRCYPGGQTHTGRVLGGSFGVGGASGWNSYPAVWKEKYYKLGTEFFPLTDYGVFFILKDGEGNHLSFDPCWPVDQRIKRIEVVGPFARPREWDATTHTVLPKYKAWGLENVPIQYDWSGKIVIDSTNWKQYEYSGVDQNGNGVNLDFTRRSGLVGDVILPPANGQLQYSGRLDYTMVGACSQPGGKDNLFVVDELIPWNWGKILIYVTLWDGTFKMYQDCCVAPPVDGIDVIALDIKNEIAEDVERKVAYLDKPQTFNVKLLEHHIGDKKHEGEWFDAEGNEITYCNDALVYVWQDRGTRHRGTANLLFGAGDGWATGTPTSSRKTNLAPQYEDFNDITGPKGEPDGKIRFNDWETEIIGTYDMATNTWAGGLIDGRTFQRNNGHYQFKLDSSTGLVDTVGLDFGGEIINDRADHVIAKNEVLPLYITAYKYGDDNNDRAFSPFWDYDAQAQQNANLRRYSHEVYLAAQMAVPVEPDLDLTVLTTPEKLTAGVTPELVDVQKPLTFTVTKGSEPVNLLDGIADDWGNKKAEEEVVWNNLILDPHPDNTDFYGFDATLPQYYWIRTDLQNNDGSAVCNTQLYGLRNTPDTPPIIAFNPITIDFSQATNGRYIFRGFCANDNNQYMENWDKGTMNPNNSSEDLWKSQHQFYVRVYTPDRKHSGEAWINVYSPNVEYKVTNTEDPNKVAYDSPGDPEFIMTAADNRIYKVQVTCRDALGVLIKGVTKGVSVCGGGVKNTARFTPFSTRPKSFDFALEECMKPPCCTQIELHIGYDFTPDEKIRRDDHELFLLSGFNMNRSANTSSCSGSTASASMGFIRYNTTNKWYWGGPNPNTWDVTKEDGDEVIPWVAWDLPPPVEGWGAGAIYNHQWYGGFLFADIDQNGVLNYHDALGLDVNAQTEFYIFAEDVAYIGGLIGDNTYCNVPANADLAGFPPYNDKTDPRYTHKRFRQAYTNDQVFYLDWDAPPDNVATIDSPRIELLYADTRDKVSRDFLNPNNYDLIYGIQNHLVAVVRPADDRDVAMKEDSRVYMSGNQHEKAVYGHTKRSAEDAKAVETTIEFLPTGLGEHTAEVTFMSPNKWYLKDPYQFVVPEWYSIRGGGMKDRKNRPAEEWNPWYLDVGKGLVLSLQTEGDLYPQVKGKVLAQVKEAGTNAPVAGAKVTLSGAGVNVEMTTDAKGEATFEVKPTEMGFIKGDATAKDFLRAASNKVKVSKDATAPALTVDNPQTPTNKNKTSITGTTEPGSKIFVNGKEVQVGADGKYKADVELKEGQNVINVVAKDAAGNTTSQVVTIVLDTTPPTVILDPVKPVIMEKTYELTGRVEPGSKVIVNGKEATVVNDYFTVIVDLKDASAAATKTPVNIEATDKAGNKTTLPVFEIINKKRKVVKLQVMSPTMYVDDKEVNINPAPYIKNGGTLVPVRAISEAFGAAVSYDGPTKTVTITLGQITIQIQIGNKKAVVNGQEVDVNPPAEISGGSTMVPFRFIAQSLGVPSDGILYDSATKTITLIKIEEP